MRWKRLFLAIKIPGELREKLEAYKRKNLDPRVFQVVDSNNFHLTIIFLGKRREDKIPLIKKVISSVISCSSLENISLREIDYGPYYRNPHLVWLKGNYNPDWEKLRDQIIKQLVKAGINFQESKGHFIPHITLARIRKYSPLPLPRRKQIRQLLPFTFAPSSLWLIESQLFPQGAKYQDVAKFLIPKSNF